MVQITDESKVPLQTMMEQLDALGVLATGERGTGATYPPECLWSLWKAHPFQVAHSELAQTQISPKVEDVISAAGMDAGSEEAQQYYRDFFVLLQLADSNYVNVLPVTTAMIQIDFLEKDAPRKVSFQRNSRYIDDRLADIRSALETHLPESIAINPELGEQMKAYAQSPDYAAIAETTKEALEVLGRIEGQWQAFKEHYPDELGKSAELSPA